MIVHLRRCHEKCLPLNTRKFVITLLLPVAWLLGALPALGQVSANVTLAWNRSSAPSVVGYRVYFGGASQNYTNSVDAGNVTNATISGLSAGVTYYFAATDYSSNGLQSAYSSEISYTPAQSVQGLALASTSGIISPPLIASNGVVYQPIETGVTNGGRAAYTINIPATGSYLVSAVVLAPNSGANSFYVNFDAEPTDPTMIWDVPVTTNWTSETVSWRGNGAASSGPSGFADQFTPKLFSLTQGTHQLLIRGREANSQLGAITLSPMASTSAPPVIALTSPAGGSSSAAPASLLLAATIAPNGHTINNVQFYNGSGRLAGAASPPYAFTWTNVPAGAYALMASAVYDGTNTVASSAMSVLVTNITPPTSTLLTLSATSGSLSGPYLISNGAVYQTATTGPTTGWRGAYTFTVSRTGDYLVSATVSAPNSLANSLYVNIDTEPSDPLMIWDIPVASGFVSQVAAWRGSGLASSDPSGFSEQFAPKVFNLAQGTHQLIIRGREGNTQLSSITISPAASLPAPWQVIDLGAIGVTGSASATGGVYTIAGAGILGGTADSLRFLYQAMSGDGEIRARLSSVQNTSTNARVGVVIRESLIPGARYAFVGVSPDGTIRSQNRSSTSTAGTAATYGVGTPPNIWARLVRSNNTFYGYSSADGTTWASAGSVPIAMATNIYFGFALASGQTNLLNTSVFSGTVVVP